MSNGIVALYKIGKAIETEQKEDFAGWSHEPLTVAKILNNFGKEVTILSDVIGPNDYPLIKKEHYDNIIVFCGPFALVHNKKILNELREKTDNLILFVSDLKLVSDEYFEVKYDSILWNCARENFLEIDSKYIDWKDKTHYNYCPEFSLFEDYLVPKQAHEERDNLVYFGGSERSRTEDFFEYVFRPDTKLHVKCVSFNYDTRVGRAEYLKELNNSKYSIVFADEEYNRNGFVNTRHYENIANGVISFVDNKFDSDECLIASEFFKVGSYIEFRNKIDAVENDAALKDLLLQEQQEVIDMYSDGRIIFEAYSEVLE